MTFQFIDLCILLGCDYVDPIPKVGPNTAVKLIREHGDLAGVINEMKSGSLKTKYTVPEDYPFEDARKLFLEPDVRSADDPMCDFTWDAPDIEGLVKFLVEEKGFNEDRVRSGASRLGKSMKSQQQSRLEGFFKPKEKTEEERMSLKRKNEEKLEEAKKQKKAAQKEKAVQKAKPRGTA